MIAIVQRVTSKMIKVKVLMHKFDFVGIEGYCRNPENQYVKGDIIQDFPAVTGTKTMSTFDKETGEVKVMCYKTGEPLAFLVFA